MARELAAAMTERVVHSISDDAACRNEALATVRADVRGIDIRTERKRQTPIRTLGGQIIPKTQTRWGETLRLVWLHEQKRRLKAGDIEAIEDVVRVIGTRKGADMETESEYWARNRERLRYAAYRRKKWPIGSGAVESAVRRVINLRMKGASITWTEEHAEGILHLRAHAKSGRWYELERSVLEITGWRPSARNPKRAV